MEITINDNANNLTTAEQAWDIAREVQRQRSYRFKVTTRDGAVRYGKVDSDGLATFDEQSTAPALEDCTHFEKIAAASTVETDLITGEVTRTFIYGQVPEKVLKACTECHQPETCKRIDFCAAYRCRFGQDSKP